jgi:hypothetical protein
MSIVQPPSPSVNRTRRDPARVELDADLEFDDGSPILRLNGTAYALTVYRAEAEDVVRVVRLEKRDGTTYDGSEHPHGAECTCPDYEVRHRGLDALSCKHIRALRALGLLAPAPRTDATPAPYLGPWFFGCGRVRDEFDELAETPRPTQQDPRQDGPAAGTTEALAHGPDYRPTAADLDEMHRAFVESEAAELGMIPTEAYPADWPSWTDAERWEPTDAPDADPAGLLTLDEWIDRQSAGYAALGTDAGDLVARALAALAALVRLVGAATPATAADRIATLERDHAATLADLARA